MKQLQEHVSTLLKETDITAAEFFRLHALLRHAIGLMIASYNRTDEIEAEKIFLFYEGKLADETGSPSCEENMDPLRILRGIRWTCERLCAERRNRRLFQQITHLSEN
ncbi:MAG: hypothetical protein PHX87_03085 [Candidatus Peribacteraceae bacterium]|nr:hypothetical protein [Candidatus Peribacteraceae bacterium]MDD5742392.1 hypothetical protein [Candidatus Peribacteraceae bacterium]